MERHYVHSSALQSVGYDPVKRILELKFKDDGVWQYFSFPPSAYKRFSHADSLGNYFVTKIKGKYPEIRVEP